MATRSRTDRTVRAPRTSRAGGRARPRATRGRRGPSAIPGAATGRARDRAPCRRSCARTPLRCASPGRASSSRGTTGSPRSGRWPQPRRGVPRRRARAPRTSRTPSRRAYPLEPGDLHRGAVGVPARPKARRQGRLFREARTTAPRRTSRSRALRPATYRGGTRATGAPERHAGVERVFHQREGACGDQLPTRDLGEDQHDRPDPDRDPRNNTTMEIARSASDGPPTSNADGSATFKSTPITTKGSTSSPILSPLPTSSFSFIVCSSPRRRGAGPRRSRPYVASRPRAAP